MLFDERVHLAVLGGGFLRTPYLTSTQEPGAAVPGRCPVLAPQIIHVPAAGRRSGLSLSDPPFRRVVLSSALCRTITRDGSAQVNQEGAAVTFGFHDAPDRNTARARLSPSLHMLGEPAMILDTSGINEGRPVDMVEVAPLAMTTGFLTFISRAWQDLRHVDPTLLLEHRIPLQIETDFDIIPLSSDTFRVFLPIIGNQGNCVVYDPTLGPGSADPAGSTIGNMGTATVQPDGKGGFYIDLTIVPDGEAAISIAVADDAGQVYARSLIIQDDFPAGAIIRLPHGMIGVPYHATLPCSQVLCRLFGQDCAARRTITSITDMLLPPGLAYDYTQNAIVGTPTAYGTNYGIVPTSMPQTGLAGLGLSLTVNRPPRTLMTIAERMANDLSSGEYYSVQFMPFGSTLSYGGDGYEFRRFLGNDQPWPGIVKRPYLYGATSRQSACAQEGAWQEAV